MPSSKCSKQLHYHSSEGEDPVQLLIENIFTISYENLTYLLWTWYDQWIKLHSNKTNRDMEDFFRRKGLNVYLVAKPIESIEKEEVVVNMTSCKEVPYLLDIVFDADFEDLGTTYDENYMKLNKAGKKYRSWESFGYIKQCRTQIQRISVSEVNLERKFNSDVKGKEYVFVEVEDGYYRAYRGPEDYIPLSDVTVSFKKGFSKRSRNRIVDKVYFGKLCNAFDCVSI